MGELTIWLDRGQSQQIWRIIIRALAWPEFKCGKARGEGVLSCSAAVDITPRLGALLLLSARQQQSFLNLLSHGYFTTAEAMHQQLCEV